MKNAPTKYFYGAVLPFAFYAKPILATSTIDLFTDTAAILNSIVSNSYYEMLRGQISMYLPPEHPIIDI